MNTVSAMQLPVRDCLVQHEMSGCHISLAPCEAIPTASHSDSLSHQAAAALYPDKAQPLHQLFHPWFLHLLSTSLLQKVCNKCALLFHQCKHPGLTSRHEPLLLLAEVDIDTRIQQKCLPSPAVEGLQQGV